ncbi:SDR family oxidoreductase [Algoriphagus lacus]|uniref:SDR family oxidoreductase n=1 Tax=Algoriphagus lacus TaxID=2056311 RepID=A0A418PVZ0_9BACT|nr:glucose 1-dehydrogenase [Algoriphagus lacus]RIW18249.1 SDR family oxidoreductase [Algoriphagus lacus]
MKDKVALITGASSGIGRATAELFSAKGASVVVAARRGDELDELVNEIRSRGGKASAVVADMSKSGDVEKMVDHTLQEFGKLDFAVNNAGIEGEFSPIVDLSEEEWDRVLDINLKGVFLCLKYQAKAMLAAKQGGAIVNIGSVNSFLGFPTGSAYVSSKHALIGLTSSVSAELAPNGIRVNLVCPGIIDTPMHRRLRGIVGDAVYDQYAIPNVHLRRAGRAEEIAKTIAFLCSEEASYITGTTITPDGGFTLTI